MQYSIIRTGGKQYKVQQGEEILVELLGSDNNIVEFETLLRVNGTDVEVGTPTLGKSTKGELMAEKLGPKKLGMKYKPSGYRKKFGHRQKYITVKITEL